MTIKIIPDHILIESGFWGPQYAGEILCGEVVAILRDSDDFQYAVFEMADQTGLQVIHLGSASFKGWGEDPTIDASPTSRGVCYERSK